MPVLDVCFHFSLQEKMAVTDTSNRVAVSLTLGATILPSDSFNDCGGLSLG